MYTILHEVRLMTSCVCDVDFLDGINTFSVDSKAIERRIKFHAEFTPSFSPEHFNLPKAYFATAESVRDELIRNWNLTYDCYERMNMKQAYYLSLEFLQVF